MVRLLDRQRVHTGTNIAPMANDDFAPNGQNDPNSHDGHGQDDPDGHLDPDGKDGPNGQDGPIGQDGLKGQVDPYVKDSPIQRPGWCQWPG